jgi:hypothetical protein
MHFILYDGHGLNLFDKREQKKKMDEIDEGTS